MIKAALIDLDGFLINSEELYLEANKIYFRKLGFEFTDELHRQGTGKKFDTWITTVVPTSEKGEKILRDRNKVFMSLVREKLQLYANARQLLLLLHKNFKTALVTSTERKYVDLVFEATKIGKYFDVLITGDMVTHGKPDPECYLVAAEKLGVLSKECVVFEDAPSGVMSGKNAGMKVIAVPSQYVKGDGAFTRADVVLDSLREITLENILD